MCMFCVYFFLLVRSLEEAEDEAKKMIGDLIPREYGLLLLRQTEGPANWVYAGELPPQANPIKTVVLDDDTGPSKKRKRAAAKGALTSRVKPRKSAKSINPSSAESDTEDKDEDASDVDDGAEEKDITNPLEVAEEGSCGYTPSPEPPRSPSTTAASASSPFQPQDIDGVKTLAAIAKGGASVPASVTATKPSITS